ncbi:T5orf172 domain-containing protein [Propionibacteriaceae bacterium ES.041]|nr:T5orf172 domain-containing protein [Propionibacteriaceae bacterium ES.041]TDO93104.1 T5orf172 domain-containing protein [Enemella evansiae]
MGWSPDPAWPEAPPGWQLWLPAQSLAATDVPEASSVPQDPGASAEPSTDRAAGDGRLTFLEAENALLRKQLEAAVEGPVVELDDARVLQDVGIYRYHHPLEDAAAYQDRLRALEAEIAALVRADRAIVKSEMFTFNNSLAQGRKLANDLGRLMLRAYNAEADNALRSLRAGNVVTAVRRLEASRTAIAKLGSLMEMHIDDDFHRLRLTEIELTSDWLMRKQEEREAAREERARLREERRVQQELEAERARLDKERAHLTNTLETLRAQGRTDEQLLNRLAAVDEAIEQNDFRAANIRAGYIYVISNEGAFGPGVVKIGLTRRLEPTERISELSGASVPFRFDIHALFFSEDAVTLENELHKHFATRALNRANFRKEFFFATPAEVREVLLERVGNILEFAEHADATEYRQSLSAWPASVQQEWPNRSISTSTN